jgi:hypothetical protein
MSETGVRVVKVGGMAPADIPKATGGKTRKYRADPSKKPKFGVLKRGKTARAKPRFEGVRNPTSAPPLRKTGRIRILTEKGAATRRAKIAADAKSKPIHKIRDTLRKHNLNVRENTPEHLARKIYEDAQEAGMISPA